MQPVGASTTSGSRSDQPQIATSLELNAAFPPPTVAAPTPPPPNAVNVAAPTTTLSLTPPQQTGVRANAIGSCGVTRVFKPLCWSVPTVTKQPKLDDALAEGQRRGLDKLVWQGTRYVLKGPARDSGMTPQAQLAVNGITDAQYNLAYVPGLSDRLFNQVTPLTYGHLWEGLHAYEGIDDGSRNLLIDGKVPEHDKRFFGTTSPYARLDAWAFYLGLPQRHDTFRLSAYRPSEAEPTSEYFALTDGTTLDAIVKSATANSYGSPSPSSRHLGEVNDDEPQAKPPANFSMVLADDVEGDAFKGNRVLGHFTVERHRDARGHYLSYFYDWRLVPWGDTEASVRTGVGHPFKLYDRIYYDPATRKRI